MSVETRFVLPGEPVNVQTAEKNKILRLGPGTLHIPDHHSSSSSEKSPLVVATRAGFLRNADTKSENSFWVEGKSRRYSPAVGEHVCGIVIIRHAEGYRVDIGCSQLASLDALAFQGATKRNKPNLKVGSIVYARVSFAQPFAEPEIECFDPSTHQAQGFGELTGGMLIRDVELGRCRRLLLTDELDGLAQNIAFECAIGVNGRIWVKSGSVADTIRLTKAIKGTSS